MIVHQDPYTSPTHCDAMRENPLFNAGTFATWCLAVSFLSIVVFAGLKSVFVTADVLRHLPVSWHRSLMIVFLTTYWSCVAFGLIATLTCLAFGNNAERVLAAIPGAFQLWIAAPLFEPFFDRIVAIGIRATC
jgi:hypothetical protein